MKNLSTLILLLAFSHQTLAVGKTWTGETNLDWNTATNWSPQGVPGPGDDVSINSTVNNPRIVNGTTAVINDLAMENGSSLTIEAGGTLNISRNTHNSREFSPIVNATLTNYGTFLMSKPLLPSEGRKNGFFLLGTARVHNYGSMNITVPGDAIVYYMANSAIFTNYGTGYMTTQASNDLLFYDPGQFINHGLWSSQGTYGAYITSGTLSNDGMIIMTGTYMNAGNTTNSGCGKIVAAAMNARLGTFSNWGLVYLTGQLNSRAGNFANNGIVKYGSINGAFTNNQIAVTDNADPIFELGSAASQIIDGIYLDQEGTLPAGVYNQATNKFTPDPALPPGPTTLHLKVSQAGGSCTVTLPFVYTILVMPVTLVSFSGSKTADNQTSLNWITADEKDFDRFEIQRSEDARSFETIGVVGSAPSGTALKSYAFTDSHPTDKALYYRLKMVDTDKSFQYSKIISIRSATPAAAEQTVVGAFYPNPSQGAAEIDLYVLEKGVWVITIIGEGGKIVRSENRVLQKGMNKLEMSGLPPGLNLVRFENGKDSVLRKLVKQ